MNDDRPISSIEILLLMERLLSWHEMKPIKYYQPHNCYSFLSRLLNIPYNSAKASHFIEARAPGLQRALIGPNGYTILQALIIRYEDRLQKEKTYGENPQRLPEFKSHDERDAYFREHGEYFTLIKKSGVGKYERNEYKTLAEAQKAGHTKAAIGGGGWMIYAVIGELSALVDTIKPKG